jgi:hypothetical protein
MTTTFEFRSEKLKETFTAVRTSSKGKIDANGGAAPWRIGSEVTNYRTCVFNSKGEYLFDFGFSFKLFNKKDYYRKMTLDQIEEMITML